MTINIMFINNLFDLALNAKTICFANTVILLSDKSSDELYSKANMIVNHVKSWFDINLLELNLNKTKCMHFRINDTNHNIHEKKMYIHISSCNYFNFTVDCYLFEEVDTLNILGYFIIIT